MNQVEYYTGEPVQGSPAFLPAVSGQNPQTNQQYFYQPNTAQQQFYQNPQYNSYNQPPIMPGFVPPPNQMNQGYGYQQPPMNPPVFNPIAMGYDRVNGMYQNPYGQTMTPQQYDQAMRNMSPEQFMQSYTPPSMNTNMSQPYIPPMDPAMNVPVYPQYSQPPQQPINPMVNPNTNFGFHGFQGNPALSMIGGQGYNTGYGYNPYGGSPYYQNQQPVYQDRVVYVPGINMGTDVLFPADIEEVCDQLQKEMILENEALIAEREKRYQGIFVNNPMSMGYYNMGFNPYTSNGIDPGILAKYRSKIEQLKQEAVQRRTSLNKSLSRLVHNFLGDGVEEEVIDRAYDGYTYTIPSRAVKAQYDVDRFARMVEVKETVNPYVEHFNRVAEEYRMLIPEHANMQEFLKAQGLVQIYHDMEEEMHRRRDATRYFQDDAYKIYLRREIMKKKGINPAGPVGNNPMGYPTTNFVQNIINSPGIPSKGDIMRSLYTDENGNSKLMEGMSIADDGTLNITVPDWLKESRGGENRQQAITNELEQHFEENRARFLESIYAQGGKG